MPLLAVLVVYVPTYTRYCFAAAGLASIRPKGTWRKATSVKIRRNVLFGIRIARNSIIGTRILREPGLGRARAEDWPAAQKRTAKPRPTTGLARAPRGPGDGGGPNETLEAACAFP